MTVKEQQEWKIPPCISNWKNAKVINLSECPPECCILLGVSTKMQFKYVTLKPLELRKPDAFRNGIVVTWFNYSILYVLGLPV